MQYLLIATSWYGLFVDLHPGLGFLLLPSIAALALRHRRTSSTRSAKQQWGLMVTVYALSHAPALLHAADSREAGRGALLLFYLLLVVQMSDVMQYVSGKLFGKTKIAPVVSPSKTVEGFVGGGIAAVLIGAAHVVDHAVHAAGSPPAMSAVIVVMGFLGGLDALGGETQPGRQGLGRDDRGAWWHAGSHRLDLLRRAGVFSRHPVFLYVKSPGDCGRR